MTLGLPSQCFLLLSGEPSGRSLAHLRELSFIRREFPATVPETQRGTSRLSRYILADNNLRFYFRFIWPHPCPEMS